MVRWWDGQGRAEGKGDQRGKREGKRGEDGMEKGGSKGERAWWRGWRKAWKCLEEGGDREVGVGGVGEMVVEVGLKGGKRKGSRHT